MHKTSISRGSPMIETYMHKASISRGSTTIETCAQGVYIQGFHYTHGLKKGSLEILNNLQAYHNVLSPISPSFWGGVVNYLILLRRVMTAFKQPLGLKISGIILGSIMEALQHCILISREFSTSRGSHQ